jgi:hypothetical protein
MKRKEENRSVIEPSCTFFKLNKINFLQSNRVLDRKPDRVIGYKVLIDLTSLENNDFKPSSVWFDILKERHCISFNLKKNDYVCMMNCL